MQRSKSTALETARDHRLSSAREEPVLCLPVLTNSSCCSLQRHLNRCGGSEFNYTSVLDGVCALFRMQSFAGVKRSATCSTACKWLSVGEEVRLMMIRRRVGEVSTST